MRTTSVVGIAIALLALLLLCGVSAVVLFASRSARTMPPAWAGSASIRATLSCSEPAASADVGVLSRRLEALGLDGGATVLDTRRIELTLHGVRGPDVARALLPRSVLSMTEVLDGAVDDGRVPTEIRREPAGRSGAMGWHAERPTDLAPLASLAPIGSRFVVGCTTASSSPPDCEGAFVREPAGLGNADVESAEVIIDELTGRPDVMLHFTPSGGSRFALLTRGLVDRRLAIVIDERLVSAPVVMEEIAGGSARITMGGAASAEESLAEAHALAAALDVGEALSCDWTIDAIADVR